MKRLVVYKLEADDPNWSTRIDEAFNRVLSFAPELRKDHGWERKWYNKVVANGEFTQGEWNDLQTYGGIVANRAVDGAKLHTAELALSINQAAINLREVLAEFGAWVSSPTNWRH